MTEVAKLYQDRMMVEISMQKSEVQDPGNQEVVFGIVHLKTTQIYTHITTKGFDQIKNPLESLGI